MSSDEKLTSYQGANLSNTEGRSLPYPMARGAPPIDLVDVARQIADADQFIDARVGSNLELIARQIKQLQEEARTLLAAAERDQALHRVSCNVVKHPGRSYHLYRKSNGERYFSLLSPREWGNSTPHQHLGSYRLEADRSWSEIDIESNT